MSANEVLFYPDAGVVTDMHVLLDYLKTFKLLEEWGIPARVAWWGQREKEGHLYADMHVLASFLEVILARPTLLGFVFGGNSR